MRLWTWRSLFLSFIIILCAVFGHVASGSALEEGKAAVARGDYPTAIAHWGQVVAAPEDPAHIEALIRRGEAYRALGYYGEASADLRQAQTAAQQVDNVVLEAVATQALGQVQFLQRDFAGAERSLRSSSEQARRLGLPGLAAASTNGLGNIQYALGQMQEAIVTYEQALALAQRAEDSGLVASVHRNLARTAASEAHALDELRAAREAALGVEAPYERAELLLGIGLEAQQSIEGDSALRVSYETLRQALAIAEGIDAPRLRSLATGHLGRLHEKQSRFSEARALTAQAIKATQALAAHELLMEWEWQLGRLLRTQGDHARAIKAFRRAVYHLQTIRQDLPIEYHHGRSTYRETWAPMYLDLVDLLLQEAATETDQQVKQSLLREARDTVERIKVSELQDYLKDPCVVARTEEIESLSPTTAVLYPIIFSDRLEVLVSIGGRLYHSTTQISAADLLDTVSLLANRLRYNLSHRLEAKKTYEWIIAPITPLLEQHSVDAIIFVPDGPLRVVPLAALWDGDQYLVERFAVVTAPGLTLLDPRPLPRQEMRALLAGLSHPGPAVEQVSALLRRGLTEAVQTQTSMWRGIPVAVTELGASEVGPRQRGLISAEATQALALPGVTEEIKHLSTHMSAKVLLDEEFLRSRFVEQVETQPYGVVHIASHGFFGGAPDQNFVLTYDEKLDMDQLARLLQPKQLADRPIELLVLSACQTAEGDDRTPLGLSGVAVKSGARSALGSLWPVYDDAAQQVIRTFYERLRDPSVTKAEALQQAQIHLIRSNIYRHPIFWAPFILVGNWL